MAPSRSGAGGDAKTGVRSAGRFVVRLVFHIETDRGRAFRRSLTGCGGVPYLERVPLQQLMPDRPLPDHRTTVRFYLTDIP